jgi:hypothetical protein
MAVVTSGELARGAAARHRPHGHRPHANDGIAAARSLEEDGIPVIYLTAHDDLTFQRAKAGTSAPPFEAGAPDVEMPRTSPDGK